MKRYSEHYERVYYFKEYGDTENFFIKLGYVCKPSEFVSGVGNPLINITAANGKPIFKNDNIDLSKYALLGEEIEDLDGVWLSVKETYGYAPDRVYESYSADAITRPGLVDTSGYKEFPVGHTNYDSKTDRFTMTISDVDTLSVGDSFYLNAIGSKYPVVYYNATGPLVSVISIEGNQVVMPAFQATFETSGSTYTKSKTAAWINGSTGWIGTKKMIRTSTSRDPLTVIANVKNQISFSSTFPQLDSRLIISLGNNETDTITESTNPSTSAWKDMIAAQEYYNVQDATVEAVFPNALYKKMVKMTIAK